MLRPAYFNFLSDYVYLTISIEQILVKSNQEEQSQLSDDDDDQESVSQTETEESDEELEDESQLKTEDFAKKVKIDESADENEFEQV